MVKRVDELRDEGMSYEKATQQAAEFYGYSDVRAFRRRIADWRRVYTDSNYQEPDET